jgi:hypothetical protein
MDHVSSLLVGLVSKNITRVRADLLQRNGGKCRKFLLMQREADSHDGDYRNRLAVKNRGGIFPLFDSSNTHLRLCLSSFDPENFRAVTRSGLHQRVQSA